MQKQEIIKKLTSIFREVFSDPTLVLQNQMTANDVDNWDSLTHMLMITEVEKQFGIKFRMKDLNQMKEVGNLISIIESKFV